MNRGGRLEPLFDPVLDVFPQKAIRICDHYFDLGQHSGDPLIEGDVQRAAEIANLSRNLILDSRLQLTSLDLVATLLYRQISVTVLNVLLPPTLGAEGLGT